MTLTRNNVSQVYSELPRFTLLSLMANCARPILCTHCFSTFLSRGRRWKLRCVSRSERLLHPGTVQKWTITTPVSSPVYSNWGERGRATSCGSWTQRTLCDRDRRTYTYVRTYVHRYCACAALRANVAGRIGNGFSPAESSFLCPNPMMMMIWDYK